MTNRRGRPIVDLVAGTRPNLVKLAALHPHLSRCHGLHLRLVHTGQHTDPHLSSHFASEMGLPSPDVQMLVDSRDRWERAAGIMDRYAALIEHRRPDVTVVVGDVDSTAACALCAHQHDIPVVHVEAGLRSFDTSMPEEQNRILTDAVSRLLLASEPSGVQNLHREGIPAGRIQLVGNVMIDTLSRHLPAARRIRTFERHGLRERGYAYATLHRPENVDDAHVLEGLLACLEDVSSRMPVIFPVHPRTARSVGWTRMEQRLQRSRGLVAIPPQPYVENLSLLMHARVALTDSGGIQDETSVLGVPCITMRDTTERPITVQMGTNVVAGSDRARISRAFEEATSGGCRPRTRIPGWDGEAAVRASSHILALVTG